MAEAAGDIGDRLREARDLRRRFEKLEEIVRRKRLAAEGAGRDLDHLRDRIMVAGCATPEGCRRLRERFGSHASFYRTAGDLTVSSLGMGTSRGEPDRATDAAYVEALEAALSGGINLIDTAINYRFQRSECAVGSGIRAFLAKGSGSRDEMIVCSKGGFLVPGAFDGNSIPVVEGDPGFHSLSADFLADQLNRSRRNLGLETIDVYYVHNPEVQLPFIGETKLLAQLTAAFARLERSVSEGQIRHYGVATWSGFASGALSLPALIEAARKVAGDDHHFRFVQLPFNRDMPEAVTAGHQGGRTVFEIAAEAGVTVIASAALGGQEGGALDALQFARSTRGITSALVGMRQVDHVRENLSLASLAPLAT